MNMAYKIIGILVLVGLAFLGGLMFRGNVRLEMTKQGADTFGGIAETLNKEFYGQAKLVRAWTAQGVNLVEVKYPNGEKEIFNTGYWNVIANEA